MKSEVLAKQDAATAITTSNIANQSVKYATNSGGVAWTNVTSKPATYPPSTHTHNVSDVTGLQTALDAKQSTATAITTTNIGNQTVKHATTAGTANAVAWANVSGKPTTFAPSSHTHDDRYFTEAEVATLLEQRVHIGSFANNRLSLQWVDTTSELRAFIDGVDVGSVTIAKG